MEHPSTNEIYLINQFPDFSHPGFDIERYNSIFEQYNVIINARSSTIEYGDHWGPLSIKCAFGGREFYRDGKSTVAVDDAAYLIFNSGKIYSSYINSDSPVESLTVNFNSSFVSDVVNSLAKTDLEENRTNDGIRFTERLYPHDSVVTPLLLELRRLSLVSRPNKHRITELFAELLEHLILGQETIRREINAMPSIRHATRKELYQRLLRAKDYIESCFDEDLSLTNIAEVAHLAPAYFLREFKKKFYLTPHQYLTERRIEEAKYLLTGKNISVSEICLRIGYGDISSFSKLFKAHTGFSPDRYRSITRTTS